MDEASGANPLERAQAGTLRLLEHLNRWPGPLVAGGPETAADPLEQAVQSLQELTRLLKKEPERK